MEQKDMLQKKEEISHELAQQILRHLSVQEGELEKASFEQILKSFDDWKNLFAPKEELEGLTG